MISKGETFVTLTQAVLACELKCLFTSFTLHTDLASTICLVSVSGDGPRRLSLLRRGFQVLEWEEVLSD